MKEQDFPSIFQAADKASLVSQRNYLNLMRFDLLATVAGALMSVYNFNCATPKLIVYTISGILLLIALILTFVVKINNYEDDWYKGRALAESIKTVTWRYITCAEDFESHLSQSVVDTTFIQRLDAISIQFQDLNKIMDGRLLSLPLITSEQSRVRSLSWNDRKTYYIQNRITEQKNWYKDKAEFNSKKRTLWFWIVIVGQFLAIVTSVFLIVNPNSNWNLLGLFTTLAGSGLAWLELKQYQSLKQAYTTTAMELNLIENLSFSVTSENEFGKYVLDSENAISREHTLWLAQRRK